MAFKVLHTLLEEEHFCLILGKKDCKYRSKHIISLKRLPKARKIKVLWGGHQKDKDDRTGSSLSAYWL